MAPGLLLLEVMLLGVCVSSLPSPVACSSHCSPLSLPGTMAYLDGGDGNGGNGADRDHSASIGQQMVDISFVNFYLDQRIAYFGMLALLGERCAKASPVAGCHTCPYVCVCVRACLRLYLSLTLSPCVCVCV